MAELDERERAALLRMKELARSPVNAWRIAEILKQEGFVRRDGRPWDHLTVRRVLAQGWARIPVAR